MYHKNQPNIGKYMVHHLPPTWILLPMGKGLFFRRRVPTFCQVPLSKNTLQTETSDATAFLLCTNVSHSFMYNKPWRLGRVQQPVHEMFMMDMTCIIHRLCSHIQRLGGLYPIPYPYGTTGIIYKAGIYASGADQGFRW